jgi:hypothetical protein
MAAFSGTVSPFKLAIIPCIAPFSAVPVFSEGICFLYIF